MESYNELNFNGPTVFDELTEIYTMSWVMTQLYPNGPLKVSDKTLAIFINIMNFKSFNRRFGNVGIVICKIRLLAREREKSMFGFVVRRKDK